MNPETATALKNKTATAIAQSVATTQANNARAQNLIATWTALALHDFGSDAEKQADFIIALNSWKLSCGLRIDRHDRDLIDSALCHLAR